MPDPERLETQIVRVEPKFKLGWIKKGEKLGAPVVLEANQDQTSIVLRDLGMDRYLMDEVVMEAIIRRDQPDTVILAISDGSVYYPERSVTGPAIDTDPDLRGKLRFIGNYFPTSFDV